MQAMMRLSVAKNHVKTAQDRAKSTNNDVLQVEQEKDATEKEYKICNGCWNQRELEHMLPVPMMMRTVVTSHRTTGTSLIIVVILHVFKTTDQLLSALTQKFQLHRKARRARWSILDWGLWDGLCTGVLENVLLL